VIVDGVQKARPGQKVAAREQGDAAEGVAAQKEGPPKPGGA
jgi:hypothetical protein